MKRAFCVLLLLALLPVTALANNPLPEQLTLAPGDVMRFTLPFKGYWESEDPEVANADSNVITAFEEGFTVLSLVSGEGDEFQVEVEVTSGGSAPADTFQEAEAEVDDSVGRVLRLKQKYGLLDATDADVTEAQIDAAVEGCGSAAHRQIGWDIAESALTLLKNENDAFPMRVGAGERTLILFSAASRAGAGALSEQILKEKGALPEGASIESLVIEPDTAEACVAAAKAADHVLLVSRAWAADCLDPTTENGFPVGIINQIIDELHAAGKTAVVISAQLPYDAACFPEADAILLTYGSSAMRDVPAASGAGSAWAPNLPAAICAAFGAARTGGKLPVDLPALDEAHHLTGETLYARQTAQP